MHTRVCVHFPRPHEIMRVLFLILEETKLPSIPAKAYKLSVLFAVMLAVFPLKIRKVFSNFLRERENILLYLTGEYLYPLNQPI